MVISSVLNYKLLFYKNAYVYHFNYVGTREYVHVCVGTAESRRGQQSHWCWI